MIDQFSLEMSTRVKIIDGATNEVLVDKSNAVHPQNVSRVIARALSREPNYFIKRIAFGNGGTFTDAAGNIVYNTTNTEGWDARLYNETYSEIVDDLDPNFKDDPGSAEAGNIRLGGGAVPSDDPAGGGVTSTEVGTKSNLVIRAFINQNEPTGQIESQDAIGTVVNDNERCFVFDELGLYSPGLPAIATNGYSNIDVDNKTSTNNSGLLPNTSYTLSITVDNDSTPLTCTIQTPIGGTGAANAITYGDLCEGINSGEWIVSGFRIDQRVYVSITDRSGGTYPSIINQQTYGLLNFRSKLAGSNSRVVLNYISGASSLLAALSSSTPSRVNVGSAVGTNAGVQNDPSNPNNERERLLTHMIFTPIVKTADRSLLIEYTITVSIKPTTDSRTVQTQTNSTV
jgi:hypothetical protein